MPALLERPSRPLSRDRRIEPRRSDQTESMTREHRSDNSATRSFECRLCRRTSPHHSASCPAFLRMLESRS